MFRLALMTALVAVPAASARQGGPVIYPMGDLPGGAVFSQAYDYGSFRQPGTYALVGESRDSTGSWAVAATPGEGMVRLGSLAPTDHFSRATAAALGTAQTPAVIVGHSGFAPSPLECRAFRWTLATGMQALPDAAGGGTPCFAHGVSQLGDVIVGQAGFPGGTCAYRWTAAGGTVLLGPLPGASIANSSAAGLTPDGQLIVGHAMDAGFTTHAVYWASPSQAVSLGHLSTAGFRDSRAYACAQANGVTVIVGESTSPSGPQEAFVWTPQGGMVGLGDLPGGEFRSVALAVDYYGEWVAGWSDTGDGPHAFLWSHQTGMRDMNSRIAGWHGAAGWKLTRATAVRGAFGDGVVGVGINPQGFPDGWVTSIDGCYADCNGDGALSLADFGCFQTWWAFPELYVDCNRDGVRNFADFGCFQTRFALGCP